MMRKLTGDNALRNVIKRINKTTLNHNHAQKDLLIVQEKVDTTPKTLANKPAITIKKSQWCAQGNMWTAQD
jgi:hypothetical protein